jgi:hypothetical protein
MGSLIIIKSWWIVDISIVWVFKDLFSIQDFLNLFIINLDNYINILKMWLGSIKIKRLRLKRSWLKKFIIINLKYFRKLNIWTIYNLSKIITQSFTFYTIPLIFQLKSFIYISPLIFCAQRAKFIKILDLQFIKRFVFNLIRIT